MVWSKFCFWHSGDVGERGSSSYDSPHTMCWQYCSHAATKAWQLCETYLQRVCDRATVISTLFIIIIIIMIIVTITVKLYHDSTNPCTTTPSPQYDWYKLGLTAFAAWRVKVSHRSVRLDWTTKIAHKVKVQGPGFLLLCRIHFPWLFQTKWIIFPE